MPLIELQSDEILCEKLNNGKYNLWKTNDIATKYPLLWNKQQFCIIAFALSYLVKSRFSHVSYLSSKVCNKLDIKKREDI